MIAPDNQQPSICDLNAANVMGPRGADPLQTTWPATIPGAQYLYQLLPVAQISLTNGQSKSIVTADVYRNILWFSADIPGNAGSGCFCQFAPDSGLLAAQGNTAMFSLTNIATVGNQQNLCLFYPLHGFLVNLPWQVSYLGAGTCYVNAWSTRYKG